MFYGKNHAPLSFVFSHTPKDFIVEEVPLYESSLEGEHLVLFIRKKNITTFDLLEKLANFAPKKDIGYAGLKDKNALTYQYISVPFKTDLSMIEDENIKILDSKRHNNKLKIGHLKGNKFFIRLKKVDSLNAKRLEDELKMALAFGFPNYFGYQRFGNFNDNYKLAASIKKPIKRQSKKEKFLISALQSFYFNSWLDSRLKLSSLIDTMDIASLLKLRFKDFMGSEDLDSTLLERNVFGKEDTLTLELAQSHKIPYKLLKGDICKHFPYGKYFDIEDLKEEYVRFESKDIAPTGLLSGEDSKKQSRNCLDEVSLSKTIESSFTKPILALGTRRYAWSFISDLKYEYKDTLAHFELSFFLPSGSYATSFLEYIKNEKL
ncbi:tRNA pseudouridine(13) synthase TruD [Helicobacter sp. 11S02629-2]|uniref:tRNA pseudouridine(13) synthase TruD n=1 Tax=Helicobacter sp. 11S02629-2 TaxID=1476195 RepID=UPI000BA5E6B4|nr:tRNA pseudouridine(13) synthase TruD [Helicobacter sp. 11S02629-2]PAF41619.1 tRNA pseudouridine(13) synthase TruD [Helicobacter sp. 11S02629-2]